MPERRAAHKVAHAECPNGASNWAECAQFEKEARGRCVALTEKETECTNWATDEFEERGYCGQHYGARVNAALEARRQAAKMARRAEVIERFMAWTQGHPSVWDRMPADWQPRQPPTANQAQVSHVALTLDSKPGKGDMYVPWRASSGEPFRRSG